MGSRYGERQCHWGGNGAEIAGESHERRIALFHPGEIGTVAMRSTFAMLAWRLELDRQQPLV